MKTKCEIAAKWWADHLRKTRDHDNGNEMQSAMMNILTKSNRNIPEYKIDYFEKHLAKALEQATEFTFISVDYGPDMILSDSMNAAKLEGNYLLPVKTSMWFHPDKIKVAVGYRAPIETIWSASI